MVRSGAGNDLPACLTPAISGRSSAVMYDMEGKVMDETVMAEGIWGESAGAAK